jgi:hypothetical protein
MTNLALLAPVIAAAVAGVFTVIFSHRIRGNARKAAAAHEPPAPL